MADQEFYVGYLADAPPSYRKWMRRTVGILAVFLGILAFVLVRQQRGFSAGQFEFGSYTTVEGVLDLSVVPTLRMFHSENSSQSLLLVGFGKFGAEGTIRQMEKNSGVSLDGRKVKLAGTLIYRDGVSLLELSEGAFSLVSQEASDIQVIAEKESKLGMQTVQGEIIDPKCYFGVMKPGEGKPHRSCAIRCISGGIPPFFRVEGKDGQAFYYLLRGPKGEDIRMRLLDHVGEGVQIKGQSIKYGGIPIIYMESISKIF